MNERVVIIIPAKSFSRRLPGKNLRFLNNKPLIHYTIEAALESQLATDVFVTTDSLEVKAYSEKIGARVPYIRSSHLSGDDIHASVPVLDMLEKLGGRDAYSYCVMLLPTSPLRSTKTIDGVIRLALERRTNVLSVSPLSKTLFHLRTFSDDGRLRRVTRETIYNIQTEDAPGLFYINGACYCAPTEDLLKYRTYQYGDPVGYKMDLLESIDVDTEQDFDLLDAIVGRKEQCVPS